MKIAVNAIPLLSRMTGIGNCIYNIAKHLLELDKANQYLFYYGYFTDKLQSSQEPAEETQELKFNFIRKIKPFIKKMPLPSDWVKNVIEEYNKYRSIPKKIDIYYEPNYIPTKIYAKKLITTIHDLSFHFHPEWHPQDRIDYFKKYFYSRINRSDQVTTVSEFAKGEILQVLKFAERDVHVVPNGYDGFHFRPYDRADLEQFRNRYKLPERYVLFVGSIEPRKNILGLLKAYLTLPEHLKREYKLVLAGFSGWENKDIMELIGKMKQHVIFLGYLNILELGYAYNLATAFAYPSLYEGFGLPPLEAMACGTPVLVSNATSLPEVCGDAALYCNPLDETDIAAKLQKLMEDETLRGRLRLQGLARARQFTWDKSALAMAKIFSLAAGK